MAGKFLTLEEAASHLGVTIEEINRLVDRKQLFPMRDGATVKFRIEDIDRVAADRSGSEVVDDLVLDLSSASLAGSGPIAESGLDDELLVLDDDADESDDDSIFGDQPDKPGSSSGTMVRKAAADSGLAAGPGSALGSSDLELDSIIAASSSPSLAKGPTADSNVAAGGSGTLAIDLSNLGSSPLMGSGAGLSAPSLSDRMGTSGISLEGDDLAASGIDLAASGIGGVSGIGGASGASGVGSGLSGEAFELGTNLGDDDSASVVMPAEESGDSSFFGAIGEESSASLSVTTSTAAIPGEDFIEAGIGPPFNAWQLTGLVCTALLLLLCGFVMIDLVWSIRSPSAAPLSGPLLKAMADTFAWK